VTRFRRFAPLVLVAAVVAVWLFLGPKIPHDQTVHVVLGNSAPRVTELTVGYAHPEVGEAELTRQATFHWAEGAAPRIVTHTPRLSNGDYLVEIEVATRNGHAKVERRVKLDENPVSIDVQEAVK
jgi:hypothetical protein